MVKISPSVLSSDFLTLKEDLKKLEAAGADMLHLDVMDGLFVPNISFGMPVIESIKKHTNIPLDVHLMIEKPHRYIKEFAKVADYLGFHYEAGSDVLQTLKQIKELGCKSCLTIKPKTDPEEIFEFLPFCDMVLVMSVEPGFGGQGFIMSALDKLRKLKQHCLENNYNILLEVDGGINEKTAPLAIDAGATVLVAGSYIFSADDITQRAKSIKQLG